MKEQSSRLNAKGVIEASERAAQAAPVEALSGEEAYKAGLTGQQQAAANAPAPAAQAPAPAAQAPAPAAPAPVAQAPAPAAQAQAPAPAPAPASGPSEAELQAAQQAAQQHSEEAATLRAELSKHKESHMRASSRADSAEQAVLQLERKLAQVPAQRQLAPISRDSPGGASMPPGATHEHSAAGPESSDETEKLRRQLEEATARASKAEGSMEEMAKEMAQMRMNLAKELKTAGVGSERAEWEHAVTKTIIEQQKHANKMIATFSQREETNSLELASLKDKNTSMLKLNADLLHRLEAYEAMYPAPNKPLLRDHFAGLGVANERQRPALPHVPTPIALQAEGKAEYTYHSAVHNSVLPRSSVDQMLSSSQYTTQMNRAAFAAQESMHHQQPAAVHPLRDTGFEAAKLASRNLASALRVEQYQ
eukprot:TRINITY_DN5156_c0_g2_i3.p1 TRINITY_DN5156_c0_g2~~TRINITY_DN5156_c0_g2_i3.p1  ORF type:complete len:422 (+),score=157.71 TRINITY_DN5156_c0_g2_i3:201-1466(+)